MLCIKSTLLHIRSLPLTLLSLYCTALCMYLRLYFLLSRHLYLLFFHIFMYTYDMRRKWIRDEAKKMKGYFAASMWVITENEREYKSMWLRMKRKGKAGAQIKAIWGGINTNLRLKVGKRENMQSELVSPLFKRKHTLQRVSQTAYRGDTEYYKHLGSDSLNIGRYNTFIRVWILFSAEDDSLRSLLP